METEETKKRNYLGGKGCWFYDDQCNWLGEWAWRMGKRQLVYEAAAEILHSKGQAGVAGALWQERLPFAQAVV